MPWCLRWVHNPVCVDDAAEAMAVDAGASTQHDGDGRGMALDDPECQTEADRLIHDEAMAVDAGASTQHDSDGRAMALDDPGCQTEADRLILVASTLDVGTGDWA